MPTDDTFVKFKRSNQTEEIIKDRAFSLLALIAIRAKRSNGFNIDGLEVGEAMIGDYKACGMTEQTYRTSKKKLEKWGFATFKATNKGTIAKLINSIVFDINIEHSNEQANTRLTDDQRTGNERVTTNKNEKNEKNEKKRDYPDFLDMKLWQDFKKHRIKLQAPMTDRAEELAIMKLENFKERGFNPNDILKNSIEFGWKGLFEPKEQERQPKPRTIDQLDIYRNG